MKLENLNRLVITGFLSLYLAGMGSLLAISAPIHDSARSKVLLLLMLPVAVIGIGLIAFEKMQTPAPETTLPS